MAETPGTAPGLSPGEVRGGRIAFLTTAYPKVSHTFIRREILALESLGWEVVRLAIRDAGEVLNDPEDLREAERTRHCLRAGAGSLLLGAFGLALRRPERMLRTLALALRMARVSERGLVRHLGYLVEACWLLRACEEAGARHVHVHFGTNAAAVARLARRLGGPSYSMTVHGPDEFDAPLGLDLTGKIRDASFVAGISHFCVAQLRRWARPEDWSRIHRVRCGVPDDFGADATPVDEAAHMLLTVGRLSAQKGHPILLEAVARLRDEGRAVSLVFAGDGELRAEVEREIAARDLADAVRITGWVTGAEVRKLLRECRALVLPSFAEGLPVVLMEAFAAGRPVVSTWVAGIPELVRDGESGWLVAPGEPEALAGALREVLDASAAELDTRAAAGRARVQREHHDLTEARRLSELLARALEGR